MDNKPSFSTDSYRQKRSGCNVTRFLFQKIFLINLNPLKFTNFRGYYLKLVAVPFYWLRQSNTTSKKITKKYSESVKFLNENVYVDDIIGSQKTIDQAVSTSLQCINIFKDESMHLHKWHINSLSLSKLFKKENGK